MVKFMSSYKHAPMPIAPDIYKRIISAKLYMDENFHEAIDLGSIARRACQEQSVATLRLAPTSLPL
jgi:hypothetical protein